MTREVDQDVHRVTMNQLGKIAIIEPDYLVPKIELGLQPRRHLILFGGVAVGNEFHPRSIDILSGNTPLAPLFTKEKPTLPPPNKTRTIIIPIHFDALF